MLKSDHLANEIDTAMKFLECPYKAPEQKGWAHGFLNRIKEEFACRGADLLADKVLLAEKVADYNKRNPIIWYSGVLQKTSSNENPVGDKPLVGNFEYPKVGSRFHFFYEAGKFMDISEIKSITSSSDGRNLILETKRSVYELRINSKV